MFPKINPKNKVVYSVYNATQVYAHTRKRERRMSRLNKFYDDYATEIDIISDCKSFPEWIYKFREEILQRIPKSFMNLCETLKNHGVNYKIKYPILIDEKYKFADIYLTDYKIVIVCLNSQLEFSKPICSIPEKTKFFSKSYKVIECYEYEVRDIFKKLNRLIPVIK